MGTATKTIVEKNTNGGSPRMKGSARLNSVTAGHSVNKKIAAPAPKKSRFSKRLCYNSGIGIIRREVSGPFVSPPALCLCCCLFCYAARPSGKALRLSASAVIGTACSRFQQSQHQGAMHLDGGADDRFCDLVDGHAWIVGPNSPQRRRGAELRCPQPSLLFGARSLDRSHRPALHNDATRNLTPHRPHLQARFARHLAELLQCPVPTAYQHQHQQRRRCGFAWSRPCEHHDAAG